MNHVLIYQDQQQCLQYIESLLKDERIILIVNENLGREFLLQISQFHQIISIYIYCPNKHDHGQWIQQYSKIKGVFDRLNNLIHQIQSDQIQRQHYKFDEPLSIGIFNLNAHEEGQSSTKLNDEFIHY
ncbi:unnamed protein product [Rotaria sordida]|uniref:Uncharacterized protein n=1 Tax=Rotaria sordida TaxID=392033 RepID=A0A816A8Q8_9BILA|nr:unnamed protein product [Rotaria sordida]CAF1594202.1 unnamed protein product [Rotaria sordida]